MPRPPKPVTRDRQLNLSLTIEEYGAVRDRAAALGQRPSSYARAVLMGGAVRIERASYSSGFDRLVYQQLARIGSNLNQLVRKLNGGSDVSVGEVTAVLARIRALLDERRP